MDMDVERRLRRLEWTNRFLMVLLLIGIGSGAVGYVNAQGHAGKIVASSIETRSLKVDDPGYGKQGLEVSVGDDGIVGLSITDVKGELVVGLSSVNPVGEPVLCLSYEDVCRVAIGDVYRGNQREFNVQLRDRHGNPIWMPSTANAYVPSNSQ
jgi:hypothetical protein